MARIPVVDIEQPPTEEDYTGWSVIAVGLRIEAENPAEANARLAKLVDGLTELVESAAGIRFTAAGRETIFACEQTARQHENVERALRARQARDQ